MGWRQGRSGILCRSIRALVAAMLVLLPGSRAVPQAMRVSVRKATPQIVLFLGLAASPSMVNFNLVAGGAAAGSSAVTVTTSYTVSLISTTVNVYAFFSSASAALTDSSADNLPSSVVFGQVTTGLPTGYTAFTQTNAGFGAAGASLQLLSFPSGLLGVLVTRNDTLNLKIDLTGQQAAAGSYTGTMTLQAQAL